VAVVHAVTADSTARFVPLAISVRKASDRRALGAIGENAAALLRVLPFIVHFRAVGRVLVAWLVPLLALAACAAPATAPDDDRCADVSCLPVGSGTNVPGGEVSGRWTRSGSPYRVLGHIQVPKGSSLTIDPGVVVEFQGRYRFRVHGRISWVGTAAEPIIFTTTAADRARGGGWLGWLGVRIAGAEYTPEVIDHGVGIFDVRYCIFEYVDKSGGVQGHPWEDAAGNFYAHGYYSSDLVLDDNVFRYGRSDLLALYPGSLSFGALDTYHYRNVFEHSAGDHAVPINVAHVYAIVGSQLGNLHFVNGAVRHSPPDARPTVAFTWDTPLYLDRVEIVDAGDRADWFLAANPPGAQIHYTAP
jgi:hypothetical protein